jgi:hypothetical protein
MGLLLLLRGGRVVALTTSTAVIEQQSGARLTYTRRPPEAECVPVWELPSYEPSTSHGRRDEVAMSEGLACDDAGIVLLRDIRDVFAAAFPDDHPAHTAESAGPGRPDEGPRLATKELLDRLCAIEERPWCAWGRARKPITDMGLAALLRPYGVHSGTVWLSEIMSAKGYYLRSFEIVFARYLPLSEVSGRQAVRNPENQGFDENPEMSGTQPHLPPRIGKPKSQDTPATPTSWIQYNDRRWPSVAKRWQRENGAPLRAQSDPGNPGASGFGTFVPTRWLVGGRPEQPSRFAGQRRGS